jgi:hypothetical protein
MASPYQQQSLRRKLIYFALILVLFTVTTFFWRGAEALGTPAAWTLAEQARSLGLRDQDRGDVDLTGSAVRLMLTGSRGLVVCGLWIAMQESMKKNEWSDVELYVQQLTKLQPHFLAPWQYQSWNLAYNVSVECDRIRDKYYFMSRGIQLLAQGERQNRNQPDLRHHVGFYYQHKIMQSDETNTLRSLFQMSCIDPIERHALRLRFANGTVNLEYWEGFCKAHPQLVRRLRDKLGLSQPDDVVDFLVENHKVPSLFEEPPYFDPDDRDARSAPLPQYKEFPILPPPRRPPPPQRLFDDNERDAKSKLGDDFDGYGAARAWYAFAQEPLPDAIPSLPGHSKESTDRLLIRKNRQMATAIFRTYPARAQSYVAERLEQEGWFEGGWTITGWFKAPLTVGPNISSPEQWQLAYEKWQRVGRETGLYLPPQEQAARESKRAAFLKATGLNQDDPALQLQPAQVPPEHAEGLEAHRFLYWQRRYLDMTNFSHHYHRAAVLRLTDEPKPVRARRLFWEADQYRLKAADAQALSRYREALELWRDVLLSKGPDIVAFRRDPNNQEEVYEHQFRYLRLYQENWQLRIKNDLMLPARLRQACAPSTGLPDSSLLAALIYSRRRVPLNLEGPLDGKDEQGIPLIGVDARETVHNRLNVGRLAAPPPPSEPTPAQPKAP